jgi:peptidoglycan/LPS O-acetylase OafA/YrhL
MHNPQPSEAIARSGGARKGNSRPLSLSSKYRPDIDGLRAIAIVAVIVNHMNAHWLPSGFLGVDVFFVISGFVITSSINERSADTLGTFLVEFYSRRIRRLLPALAVFVLCTGTLICVVGHNPGASVLSGLLSLIGASNLHFFREATDYFAPSSALNPFLHTWSLGVEEQFYLVFPFLLWGSGFVGGRRAGSRTFALLLSSLAAPSLIAFVTFYRSDHAASFFLMPARFWEMAAGSLAYQVGQSERPWRRTLERVPVSLLLCALAVALALPRSLAVFTTVSVVLLSSLLVCLPRRGAIGTRVLSLPWVVAVGKGSYSLYLWHWGVLCLAEWVIGTPWWGALVEAPAIGLLALGSYRFVEVPFRSRSWGVARFSTITKGVLIVGITALTLMVVRKGLRTQVEAANRWLFPPRFSTAGIVQEKIYCHLPERTQSAFEDCLEPKDLGKPTIFVLGDSHSSNHVPSIQGALKRTQSLGQVQVLVDWGFINSLEGVDSCGSHRPCIEDSWVKQIAFLEKHLESTDLVVFSWFRKRVLADGAALPPRPDPERIKILEAKLLELLAVTRSRGGQLVLVDDTPQPCSESVLFASDILRRGEVRKCQVTTARSKEERGPLTELFRRLERHGALYFDPHDALCESGVCGVLVPGTQSLRYGDASGHFTLEFPAPLKEQWSTFLHTVEEKRMSNLAAGSPRSVE